MKNINKMNKTSDISVIIPIHELNDDTKIMLGKAIKSIEEQIVKPDELIFVIPSSNIDIKNSIVTNGEIKVTIIENDGDTDFCSQINLGVDNVKTKYFSFLEFDDEYSKIWFKNAVEYIDAYPEVGVFLPLIIDVDPNSSFIGFANEAVWANGFSDELGLIDLNALLTYQNFNFDGMVMSVENYKESGGLKSNIKLTFMYEFLLRLANLDIKIMTLPKFGYKHMNQRKGSLFTTYNETLTIDEAKWWLAKAKKEYYFDYSRVITKD